MHGWHKVLHGIENQTEMLASNGLPGLFMYFAYVSEVLAPVLIVLGIYTRLSVISIVVTMIVILYVIPAPLLNLNEHGAFTLELQYFYLLTPAALLFLGTGRYRVWNSGSGHWLLD
jgi:putative oxidoreductase